MHWASTKKIHTMILVKAGIIQGHQHMLWQGWSWSLPSWHALHLCLCMEISVYIMHLGNNWSAMRETARWWRDILDNPTWTKSTQLVPILALGHSSLSTCRHDGQKTGTTQTNATMIQKTQQKAKCTCFCQCCSKENWQPPMMEKRWDNQHI
jgi:hypothetical protein